MTIFHHPRSMNLDMFPHVSSLFFERNLCETAGDKLDFPWRYPENLAQLLPPETVRFRLRGWLRDGCEWVRVLRGKP